MKRNLKRSRLFAELFEQLESRVLLSALPVVTLNAGRAKATELNGATTGAGWFTVKRSGSTAATLTVNFTIDSSSTALNGVDYDHDNPLTGTVEFAAGAATASIYIYPVDTNLADGPKTVILNLTTSGGSPIYTIGSRHTAKVTIADHAPTVTVALKKGASEIDGTGKGAGVFQFKRTGSTTSALTVNFTLAGSATEGTDYATLTHSVTFNAGQTIALVTVNPIDDVQVEGTEKVIMTIAGDGTPASYHFTSKAATMGIADDRRPIFFGTISPIAGALTGTPFTITHDDLLAATGVRDLSGNPISFKITAIKSGTLTENGTTSVVVGKSMVTTADALTWSPATNATGSFEAFNVIAYDGRNCTKAVTLSVIVARPAGTVDVIPHPDQIQVLSAALDQPQINAIVYVGNNTVPQMGTTTTWNDNLEEVTVNTFNVSAYLDTGASGILISNPTNSLLNLPLLSDNGEPVMYTDVGVAGSDAFNVSDSVRLSLANFYQRTDLDQFSDAAQTIPITTPYTPIPAPGSSVHVEVGPYDPLVDNPVTDEYSSLISDLSALDVIGMPAMLGRVTVIDPTRVNNFGSVVDALQNDPTGFDWNILDTDLSVHSFIYDPGTAFHPTTTATDPGIPDTAFHVKLSYGSFDQFTQVTPDGATGPTLAHNPFIGEDPVRLLEGVAQPDVPGIKIARTVTAPNGSGGTTEQTLTSEGNWLLDTGAAASIISKAQAAKVGVTYQDGTEGTDTPVLVDQNGVALPEQFTLKIGGIGGQGTLAGFYLDSMMVRTQEGSATDDSNPNNLVFVHEPVLVGDISLEDPVTHETLTLDGIFGMNNLIGSADFSMDSNGGIGDFTTMPGYFNWITFDEPNGVLGLNFDPAALDSSAAAAAPATAMTPTAAPAVPAMAMLPAADATPVSIVDATGGRDLAAETEASPLLVRVQSMTADWSSLPAVSSSLASYLLVKAEGSAGTAGGAALDGKALLSLLGNSLASQLTV